MRLIVVLCSLLAGFGCSENTTKPSSPEPFTVMTWNLYLGANLTAVLNAPTPAEVPVRAAEAWAQVQATDFASRASQIAKAIVDSEPDVIGLQEVALYRIQSPGDAGVTPAVDVAIDHLEILMEALEAAGLDYTVASSMFNFDVEVPVWTGSPLDDVRLTDRDVILVRKGISVREARQKNFEENAELQIAGAPAFAFLRGWTSVVVDFHGQEIRVVNTHLESQLFASEQQAQAQELIDEVKDETRPVLIVGDLNSDAVGPQSPTYGMIVSAGCQDLWKTADGNTCCQSSDLLNAAPTLSQRIDFVLSYGGKAPSIVEAKIVGLVKEQLWPSDHAGIVCTLLYE